MIAVTAGISAGPAVTAVRDGSVGFPPAVMAVIAAVAGPADPADAVIAVAAVVAVTATP